MTISLSHFLLGKLLSQLEQAIKKNLFAQSEKLMRLSAKKQWSFWDAVSGKSSVSLAQWKTSLSHSARSRVEVKLSPTRKGN